MAGMAMQFEQQDYSLDKRSLRFVAPDLERAYIAHHNIRALPGLRLAISLFMAFVAIPALVELYGFYAESWAGYDSYLGILPYRILVVVLLACGLALTFFAPAIRHGQPLVFGFSALLFLLVFLSHNYYGPWILLATSAFNFGLTLIVVATGLLIRYAAPLVSIATLLWVGILMSWLDNAFSAAFLSMATMLTMFLIAHAREKAERNAWSAQRQLAHEKQITEALLLNVLPASIAERMRRGEQLIADKHDQVAVVFADIVNFTTLADLIPAEELVQILDDIFTRFDRIAEQLNLEKIKTIGDAYMMAAGLPVERPVNPALAVEAALRMRAEVEAVSRERQIEIDIRAGIHVGEVVAGVIGQSKFVYDLWGDVVNVASRMESTAPAGEIQISDQMHAAVADQFTFVERGEIAIKGKGRMRTWLLKSDPGHDNE
jgi:class 3 adenylate cyclase